MFQIQQCMNCQLKITYPYPAQENLPKYYDSTDYISHANNKRSLKDIPYYLARDFMLRKKLTWINQLNHQTGKLLDYGCGVGGFLQFMSSKNWDVYGVEPNQKAQAFANKQLPNRISSTLSEIEISEFDTITLWHVLEHVENLNQTLDSLYSKLKPGKFLLIAVPNCASYDAKYYQEHWAAYDVPRHLYHFTQETMQLLAKRHRLQLLKTIPLKLDALYISILSEKYRNGSFLNGIFQGLKSNFLAQKHQGNYSSLVYVYKK